MKTIAIIAAIVTPAAMTTSALLQIRGEDLVGGLSDIGRRVSTPGAPRAASGPRGFAMIAYLTALAAPGACTIRWMTRQWGSR
jgi:hypothetical protein